LDREEGVDPSYLEEDLTAAWGRADFDIGVDTFVITSKGGTIAAYGHVESRPPTDLVAMGWVHPDHRGRGLGTDVIDVLETRARERTDAPEATFERVVNIVTEWDRPAAVLLTEAGYSLIRHFWSMEIDLNTEIQEPVTKAEATLRKFDPSEATEAHAVLVDAFRDHWGGDFPSFEDWSVESLARKNADPTLWWVAEGDGRLVGVLVADIALGTGWVVDLGVDREWRKQGIGRALLLRAFNEFKDRGLTRAALGVDSQSLTGATHLYESVGMTRYRQIDFYGKDLVTAGT
jgi:GNAT superfamily N-acetyltransferase